MTSTDWYGAFRGRYPGTDQVDVVAFHAVQPGAQDDIEVLTTNIL